MTAKTINDIPPEVLHDILDAALPPLPSFPLYAYSDSLKLEAEEEFMESQRRLLFVCKHWAQTIGLLKCYMAIGIKALEKFEADLRAGTIKGLAITNLRLETENEEEEEESYAPEGKEVEEGTRRVDVLSQLLQLCPETKHLQIFFRESSGTATLSKALGLLKGLKTLEIIDRMEWDKLASCVDPFLFAYSHVSSCSLSVDPIRLFINVRHLDGLSFRKFRFAYIDPSSHPFATILTRLTLAVVKLPTDFPVLELLLSTSHKSLDSFVIEDCQFASIEAYDTFHQIVAPISPCLKTLSCGCTYHKPYPLELDLSTTLLDPTLLTLPKIESLSLPYKSFQSLSFMSHTPNLRHLSIAWDDWDWWGSRIAVWLFKQLADQLALREESAPLLVVEVKIFSTFKRLMGEEKTNEKLFGPLLETFRRCRNIEVWLVWIDEAESEIFPLEIVESSRELKFAGCNKDNL